MLLSRNKWFSTEHYISHYFRIKKKNILISDTDTNTQTQSFKVVIQIYQDKMNNRITEKQVQWKTGPMKLTIIHLTDNLIPFIPWGLCHSCTISYLCKYLIDSRFYHDVDGICWHQPTISLELGHVTGQGSMPPICVNRVSEPGKITFIKSVKKMVDITVYLIKFKKQSEKINK